MAANKVGNAPLQSPLFNGNVTTAGNFFMGDTSVTAMSYALSAAADSGATSIVVTGEFTYSSDYIYYLGGTGIASGAYVTAATYDSTNSVTTLTISDGITEALASAATIYISTYSIKQILQYWVGGYGGANIALGKDVSQNDIIELNATSAYVNADLSVVGTLANSGNLQVGNQNNTNGTAYTVSTAASSGDTSLVVSDTLTVSEYATYGITGTGIDSGRYITAATSTTTDEVTTTTLTLSAALTADIAVGESVTVYNNPETNIQLFASGNSTPDATISVLGGYGTGYNGKFSYSAGSLTFSTSGDTNFNGSNVNVNTNLFSKYGINLGEKATVSSPALNFYSSGNSVIDANITASEGTTTANGGALTVTSDAFNIDSTMNIMSPSFNLGLNQTTAGATFINFFSNGNNTYADATIQSYGGATGAAGGGTFTITSANLTVAAPYIDLTAGTNGVMVPSTTVSDKATDKAVNMTSLSSFLQTIGTYIAVANSSNVTTLSCSTQTITAPSNGILLCYGTAFSPTTNLDGMTLSSSYSTNPVNGDTISGWNNAYVSGSQFINKGDTAVITFSGTASASAPSFVVFGYVIFTPTL